MMETARSVNGVSVRLTPERWVHISTSHDDLAAYFDDILETIEDPDYVIRGYGKALIALKDYKKRGRLAVVYKEIDAQDGFVVTAYFTKNVKINEMTIAWQKK